MEDGKLTQKQWIQLISGMSMMGSAIYVFSDLGVFAFLLGISGFYLVCKTFNLLEA